MNRIILNIERYFCINIKKELKKVEGCVCPVCTQVSETPSSQNTKYPDISNAYLDRFEHQSIQWRAIRQQAVDLQRKGNSFEAIEWQFLQLINRLYFKIVNNK